MRTPWIFVFATMIAGAAPSCGSPEASLCNDRCACEGCSDSAHRACLDDYDADIKSASFRGCLDLYNQLIDCENATGTCLGTDWQTSCHDEKDRLDNCTKK